MKKLKLKTKIIIGVLSIGIIGAGIYIYNLNIDKYRTPSVEEMYNTYMELEETVGNGYGDVYLSQFEGDRFWWGARDKKTLEKMKEKYPEVENLEIRKQIKEQAKKEEQAKKDDVEIINIYVNSNKYGYEDIDIKIKNNTSKDIKYIKLNLFFKDSNGTIKQSDWVNDSSVIKPGAYQTISKTVSNTLGDNIEVEVEEVIYK